MQSRKVIVASIGIVVVLVIGLIAWRASADRAPAPDASPEKVREFVASDRFAQLPSEEKQKYVDAVERTFEPGPQEQKMFHNLAQARMQKMLDDYFALPEGKERTAYLDKQIEQQEKMRKMMEGDTKDMPGRVVIRKGGPTAAAQKELTETVPAEYHGKMAQYVKDVKDRRAARGLPQDAPIGIAITITR